MPQNYPVHGRIDGPVVMIGFGSIGRGTLPLIERHFAYDPHDVHVIEPSGEHGAFLEQRGVEHIRTALTQANFREVLQRLFAGRRGFCVNLSVDTGSVDILRACREMGVLYIDTVTEPWPGFYFDHRSDPAERTNYALRETLLAEKQANPGGSTAVSCCGANPGMVSWLLKEALVKIAADTGFRPDVPVERGGLGAADARAWREGRAYRRARHAGGARGEGSGDVCQYLVGGGVYFREFSTGGTGLGQFRAVVSAERASARSGVEGVDLARYARRADAGAHLVPDGGGAVWLFGDA